MYDIENYFNAETIKEAVTLLKEHPDAMGDFRGKCVLSRSVRAKWPVHL